MEEKTTLNTESTTEQDALEHTTEKSDTTQTLELPEFDYNKASRKDLVDYLKQLIDQHSPLEIKSETETIKSVFYSKLTKEIEEQKEAFDAQYADEEEKPAFKLEEDALEPMLKNELSRYRNQKNEILAKQEKEREDNLKLKEELIEELKQLIDKEESLKETFDAFHSIVERWHMIGPVPASHNNDLWQTYHLHVEHFYDYIKINKDLRDLDFKKNLEVKEGLCAKAEALKDNPQIIDAFKTLQILHQQWKECGPVDKELREPLWERFKAATTEINKRHQAYFADQKEQQAENLKKKEVLCEKAEALAQNSSAKAKEWNENVKAIQALQEEWRTVGIVPKKDNASIYKRFRAACDLFFDNKRKFYQQHKEELSNNLEKKKVLLEKALELQSSDDWKATTKALTDLQKEWKTIGVVPRKYSDKIWNDFRAACDAFFERKKEHMGGSDKQQKENLQLKEALIEKIKAFETSDSPEEDIQQLLAFKDEWFKIGHVPFKAKNTVNNAFHNELNAQFDKLNLNKEDRELEKFKAKVEDLNQSSEDRLYGERKRLSQKMKDLEGDIKTWENNIGFFSKSKSSESLLKEYTNRIEKAKKQKQIIVKKIKMIDSAE